MCKFAMSTHLTDFNFCRAAKATDTYGHYMAKDDLERVLVEATANENWNIANTKLLQISDASYDMTSYNRISEFLMLKLQSKAIEWKRVLKSLNAIEFLIKNGSPAMLQRFQMDVYKIRSLSGFSYDEQGLDRGKPVREKVILICDLLQNE